MGIARGSYAVSQAVLLVLLARDVGPDSFGIVAAYIAAQTFLFLVAGMNTSAYATREIAVGNNIYASASIRLNTRVLLLGLLLNLVGTLPLIREPEMLFAVAGNAIALWAERQADNRLAIAYGRRQVKPPAVALTSESLISIALYLTSTGFGLDALVAFGIARTVSSLLALAIAVILVRMPPLGIAPPVRNILQAQVPFATSMTMGALRTLDSVIVIAIAGPAASGIYSAVSRVVSPFNTLAAAAAPVLVPRAAHANPAALRRILDRLFVLGVALSCSTFMLWPFVETLVVLVFGPSFAGGGTVLFWMLLRIGPATINPLISTALQAKGFDRLVAWNSVATSLIVLAAVAGGAAIGGAMGAAVGCAIVTLLRTVSIWVIGRRVLRPSAI